MTVVLGWWIIPLCITIITLTLGIKSFVDDMNRGWFLVGIEGFVICTFLAVPTLLSWLIWALCKLYF